MPQSRAAMAVARVARPAARRARARPVRRARRQDDPPRGADGGPRRASSPSSATRAAPRRCAAPPRAWAPPASTVRTADAAAAARARRLRPRARRPAVLGPRHARLAPRRPLAQGAPTRPARARARRRRRSCAPAPRAVRPGGTLVYSTCTISPAENEDVVRAFLAERSRTSAPTTCASDVPLWDHAARARLPADAPAPRRHRGLLHRAAAPGGARMSDGARSTSATSARPATSRGCGRRTCPAATAA